MVGLLLRDVPPVAGPVQLPIPLRVRVLHKDGEGVPPKVFIPADADVVLLDVLLIHLAEVEPDGADEVIAEVLPDEKGNVIKELKKNYNVLMIGDGINDAVALESADIAMAIGNGSDIAIESADIILTNNDLYQSYVAYELSKKTIKNIKLSLFWAFFYNIICIPIACGILYPFFEIKFNPMLASIAMSLSSVCVVLNALRLFRFKIKNNK